MKKIGIGILGFGVVGYGVYSIITQNKDDIAHREGLDISVRRALVKSMDEHFARKAPDVCTTDAEDILSNDGISFIVECMGGVEPARTFVLRALNAGKSVATSNKELIAKHWPELEKAAKINGVGLYIEATVGGGIPIIRTIIESLQANNISEIMGIINGTTNYILTRMSEEGKEFSEVLSEAQKLGYAEANPENDVEGIDAAYKLSILGSLAFHAKVPISRIYREGISKITPLDIQIGKEFGYEIKLLAIGKKLNGKLEVRVHPTMLKATHPLATVRGVFNAVFLHGHAVDDVMLYGRGAGQMPTASAVVSDVIHALNREKHSYNTFQNEDEASCLAFNDDWKTAAFINLLVEDKPGVLAVVSGILGKHSVSISSVVQRDTFKETDSNLVPLVFITHKAGEKAIQAALAEIGELSSVNKIINMIRVEE